MDYKLTLLLFCLSVPGVIASSFLMLPLVVDPTTTPVSLQTLQIANLIQGALFVLLAAILASILTKRVGLCSLTLLTLINHGRVIHAFYPQLISGLVGGLIGVAIIVGFHFLSPPPLANTQVLLSPPIAVRILYGGITEEILIRWGMMTLIVWASWRLIQKGKGKPNNIVIGLAIRISAVLFGLSHVPLAINSITPLSMAIIVYIVAGNTGNTMFGVMAGYLSLVLWFGVCHHCPRIFPYRLISNTWLGESDHIRFHPKSVDFY